MTLLKNSKGNYNFLQGIAPYSCGVIAMPGFEIIRIRLQHPLPFGNDSFGKIAKYITGLGRPLKSLCAMELRVPEPLSFEGFAAFNQTYRRLLEHRDLLLGDLNPLARTNIAPLAYPLEEPSIFAFSFTVPKEDLSTRPTFVVAGAGDLLDQTDLSRAAIIRPTETSLEAHIDKATAVMQVMQDRLVGLGVGWKEVTMTDIYSAIPLDRILEDIILKPMGAAALGGLTWFFSNPPIKGLAFEMDVRGLRKELTLNL